MSGAPQVRKPGFPVVSTTELLGFRTGPAEIVNRFALFRHTENYSTVLALPKPATTTNEEKPKQSTTELSTILRLCRKGI